VAAFCFGSRFADPTLDKDFVAYVWFDALTNYISFAGYTVGEADSFPYNSNAARPGWTAIKNLLANFSANPRSGRRTALDLKCMR
jgi:methionyl-tRNA synthetase